jgi:hypothetical protein
VANQLNLSPAEIQRIQNAILPGDVPGKYAGAYREILIINQERVQENVLRLELGLPPLPTLDELTLRWFEGAPEINEGNPNASANTYVRGVTVYGLQWDGRDVPDLQVLSNAIGFSVIEDIIANGGVPAVGQFLLNDINGALATGNVTISGWGGSFYYWDLPYLNPATNEWTTIGGVISSNPNDLEKFLAINALAAAEAYLAHGISLDLIQATWYAQLPADLKAEIMGRVFNYLLLGVLESDPLRMLAGNPNMIDGYEYRNGTWFASDNTEVTDADKLDELNTRMNIREQRADDTSWADELQPRPGRTIEDLPGDLNRKIIFDDIDGVYDWFTHTVYVHDDEILHSDTAYDDGSSTTTIFDPQAILQAAEELRQSGVNSVVVSMLQGTEFENAQELSITWEQGGTVSLGNLSQLSLLRADGSRAEATKRPPSPFGEELWDYTEYSPSGEIISHEIGTTIRATGQHVILTRERDVDENGEPTGAWEQHVEAYDPNAPDPDDLSAAQIGEIFGSQLGSLIAGDNPFAQVLAGSALATVLGNIGGAISYFNSDDFDADDAGSLSDEIDDVEIPEFSNFFKVLKGQAVGAVSGFLAAELGEALGVDGFGGQLFNTIASRSIGYVLGTVADNIFFPAANWNGDIFAGMSADGLITSLEFGIGGMIGGYLARQIVDIDSQGAAIGASLGQAIGSFVGGAVATGFTSAIGAAAGTAALAEGVLAGIGASFAEALGLTVAATAAGSVGTLASTLGAFLIPGIGVFIGVIVGSLIGSLFTEKVVPQAEGEVEINFDEGRFYLDRVFAKDGGSKELAREMAEASRDILNGYLDMIGGDNANMISPTQIYGHRNGQLFVKVDTDGDGDLDQVNVESAGEAVAKGVVYAIKGTHIEGGDIYMKRAVLNSTATTLDGLLGDLKAAEDYKHYLTYKPLIDAMIQFDPTSVFAASWVITILRAEELGLNDWATSDFYGGVKGFLASFGYKEIGKDYDEADIVVDGTTLIIKVVDDGQVVREFRIEDYADKIGYSHVAASPTGTPVHGTDGNDLWIANPDIASTFIDASGSSGMGLIETRWLEVDGTIADGSDDILIGSSLADTIKAGLGWDYVEGGAGNDWVDGGKGGKYLDRKKWFSRRCERLLG